MGGPVNYEIVAVWSDGEKERMTVGHFAAARLIVPVFLDDGRIGRVEFAREKTRYPAGSYGPFESWWTTDDNGDVYEFRFRQVEHERPQPERWLQ